MAEMFQAGHSPPCTTARRGGCVIKKNVAQQPKRTQPGWFSFCIHRKTTPASRSAELRDIFLIARPPLLAVVQGGEWPARNMVAIFFTASPYRLQIGLTCDGICRKIPPAEI